MSRLDCLECFCGYRAPTTDDPYSWNLWYDHVAKAHCAFYYRNSSESNPEQE